MYLLYTVHHESEILFRKELDSWFVSIPNWKHFYIVTSQPGWEGLTGRLTPGKVEFLLRENLSSTFFLCGPLALIRSIRKFLIGRGMPRRKIREKQFVFLPYDYTTGSSFCRRSPEQSVDLQYLFQCVNEHFVLDGFLKNACKS